MRVIDKSKARRASGGKMDLIDKIGSQIKAKGAENSEPHGTSASSVIGAGDDLIEKAGSVTEVSSAATEDTSSARSESTDSKLEAESKTVKNPDSWSKESALQEVVRLREESKQARIKYSEQLEKFKAEQDAKLAEKLSELEAAKKAEKELSLLKEKEADKKRSLEERLADRESKLITLETQMEALKAQFDSKLQDLQEKASAYEAEVSAQTEVYKNKVNAQLEKIPVKYKTIAETIVKGAGDYREALVALTEAELNGMFEDKRVVVAHNVPGAADGSRATKAGLEEAERIRRAKMSPAQLIREGLESIEKGKVVPGAKLI